MFIKRLTMAGLVSIALTTAACGGGGGGTSAVTPVVTITASPGPTASPTVTATPGSNTQSFTIPAGAAAAVVSGNVQLTTASAVQVTFGSTTPTTTSLATKRQIAAISGSTLAYITVTSDEGATLTQFGGSFTLASPVPAGNSVYAAVWDGAAWDNISFTAATVSGTSVTVPLTTLSPSVAANPNAYFALFYNPRPLQTPQPAVTATASATPVSTATSTATPSGTSTASATFVDTACAQTMATATNTLTSVASTFFTTIVPTAKVVCLSAWDLSNDIDTALIAAAKAGASVTVITPYSQNSSNASAIAAIVAAGGHAKYEYTGTPGTSTSSIQFQLSPMDIHAKFAIVDGIAYMDGHNWFTTDVVMRDGYQADYAAIQADLVNFPATAPNGSTVTQFTTDKQVSLKSESNYLQTVAIPALASGAANEYDFITESYNPSSASGNYNDDIYIGMCQIASLSTKPAMNLVFEQESGYSSAAIASLQNLLLINPAANIRTNNNGHEKISMIRLNGTPVSAWFGSSNATTTDLFDWGMTVTDPGILASLKSYFDNVELANSTAITRGSGTPTACGTVHS